MVAETQTATDAVEENVVEERPYRSSTVSFDERLAPTCMIVMMVAGLGILVLTMVIWGVSNLDKIFR